MHTHYTPRSCYILSFYIHSKLLYGPSLPFEARTASTPLIGRLSTAVPCQDRPTSVPDLVENFPKSGSCIAVHGGPTLWM